MNPIRGICFKVGVNGAAAHRQQHGGRLKSAKAASRSRPARRSIHRCLYTRHTRRRHGSDCGDAGTGLHASTTGIISPVSPVGSSSTIVCSSTPGGPPTNGAALPLSTPEISTSPPPGTIQPDITQLAVTSLDPTMSLATPGMMAPANATGATAPPRRIASAGLLMRECHDTNSSAKSQILLGGIAMK